MDPLHPKRRRRDKQGSQGNAANDLALGVSEHTHLALWMAASVAGMVTALLIARRPFFEAGVDARQRHALVRAAELERSWLHIVGTREEVARMKNFVQKAHRIQQEDPRVLAELEAFTGHRPDAADGVPPASAGVRPEAQDIEFLTPRAGAPGRRG